MLHHQPQQKKKNQQEGKHPSGSKPAEVPKRAWRLQATSTSVEPSEFELDPSSDGVDWLFEEHGKVTLKSKKKLLPRVDTVEHDPVKREKEFEMDTHTMEGLMGGEIGDGDGDGTCGSGACLTGGFGFVFEIDIDRVALCSGWRTDGIRWVTDLPQEMEPHTESGPGLQSIQEKADPDVRLQSHQEVACE